MRFAELDGVTLDAYGTLIRLVDPLPAIQEALREHGVERSRGDVERAFRAEFEFYVPRSLLGRDEESLASLHRDCAAVFLDAIGAELDPAEFAPAYVAALRYEAVPGAATAIAGFSARGLSLAVVSNFDCALPQHLESCGIRTGTVVTSAEAGVAKPDPGIFEVALARIAVAPERALHIGDQDIDEQGARAAGMHFRRFEGWS